MRMIVNIRDYVIFGLLFVAVCGTTIFAAEPKFQPIDSSTSPKIIRAEAEKGNPDAILCLAIDYAEGNPKADIKKDIKKAEDYLDKAFAAKKKQCKTPKNFIELIAFDFESVEAFVATDEVLQATEEVKRLLEKLHIKDCPQDFQDAFNKVKPVFLELTKKMVVLTPQIRKLEEKAGVFGMDFGFDCDESGNYTGGGISILKTGKL
jgi:hypothetical protein